MTHTLKKYLAMAAVMIALTSGAARAVEDDTPRRADDRPLWSQPYDSGYLFAVTRDMRDGGGSPAMVACLAPLTLVVDVFLLPIEAVLGVL